MRIYIWTPRVKAIKLKIFRGVSKVANVNGLLYLCLSLTSSPISWWPFMSRISREFVFYMLPIIACHIRVPILLALCAFSPCIYGCTYRTAWCLLLVVASTWWYWTPLPTLYSWTSNFRTKYRDDVELMIILRDNCLIPYFPALQLPVLM